MKSIDHQLERLLRAAGKVQRQPNHKPVTAPDAQWLLHQREQELAHIPPTIRPVLQGGLAMACLLLMVTLVLSVRHIGQANQDVFAASEAVLTRLSTP